MLLVPTVVKPSSIAGLGLFTVEALAKDTAISIAHPLFDLLYPNSEVQKLRGPARAFFEMYGWRQSFEYLPKWMAAKILEGETYWRVSLDNAKYTNHSFDPNLYYNQVSKMVSTRRDIEAGEELTENYAVYDADFEQYCEGWK